MDRLFVGSALAYGIAGMLLGIMMAMGKDHREMVTHAFYDSFIIKDES